MNLGYDFRKIREDAEANSRTLMTHPFSSARKKMTSIHKLNKDVKVFTKGAPELLLGKCTHYMGKGGEVKPINKDYENKIASVISTFAAESLRNILLTYKDVPSLSQSFLELPPEEV